MLSITGTQSGQRISGNPGLWAEKNGNKGGAPNL